MKPLSIQQKSQGNRFTLKTHEAQTKKAGQFDLYLRERAQQKREAKRKINRKKEKSKDDKNYYVCG